ncbi:hypothetical protein AWC38_SpisGene20727 [Stylophora pistillata]|uniref:Uncharacterized protein n=1 Tax=Stylophora pistillata TaxID=50429 RepID=A0A2B4REZ8_STYPI|nr:hypothetical protein AWC38_SpisGene20727 [Stylophora pistillata]
MTSSEAKFCKPCVIRELRQEAMVKRYTLQQLLEHAANKKDTDRQAQHMVETSPSAPTARNQINRVHQKKHQKPRDKLKPKPTRDENKSNLSLQILWVGPRRTPITVSSFWKNLWFVLEERSFRPNVQREPIPLVGCFEAEIEGVSTGKKTMTRFLVTKGITESPSLLSLDTSVKLGLLHVVNATEEEAQKPAESCTGNPTIDLVVSTLISEYHDVFSGMKAAREELRLREQGIIEVVPNNQPTIWCTNPVISSKPQTPEAIRFCPDMRVPNTAILRPVTEAPTVEDCGGPWHDLLLMLWLEGHIVHLPVPKTHFAKDISLTSGTPIFCTGKHRLMYIKNGILDERECGMMNFRWKIFHFTYQIPREQQRQVPSCAMCFAELILPSEI